MRPWLTWAIVLAVLTGLALVKIGVRVLYEEGTLRLDVLVGRFRINLIGQEKKPKKAKKKKPKEETKAAPQPKKEKPKEKKGSLLENPWVRAVLAYRQELLALVGRVLRSPTLDVLRLQLWVGGGDSNACAMNYGRICAMVGGALPLVENTFGIRKRQIEVWCCYDREKTEIAAEAGITVRIYEVFALAFAMLGLGVKILIHARNLKKAVQNT